MENFKANLALLKEKQNGNAVTETVEIAAWTPANVKLISNYPTVKVDEGISLFVDVPGKIEAVAPELKGMKADRKSTRLNSSHTRPSRMPSSA